MRTMPLLPVALKVEDKRCLVVGGGAVARRKVAALLECGAQVHVIAPQLCGEFESLITSLETGRASGLEYSERAYRSGDCQGYGLVFACTANRAVNAAVADEARRLNVWCNIADDTLGSDFHVAAAVRRGDICIGVTTSGGSPALARHLKAKVQECIGPEYAGLLDIVSRRRTALPEQSTGQPERAAMWRAILESEALELLRSGRREAAEAVVDGLMACTLSIEA